MIDIGILFQQVLILVLFVFPAVFLKKMRLADGHLGIGLSNIVLYVASPAMIVKSFILPYNTDVLLRSLAVGVFCILFHLVYFGIALLAYPHGRLSEPITKVLRFSTVFTNAGYMGIPLIASVVGSDAVIYSAFYIACFNVFVWTLGCFIYTGDRSYISLKKAFINPATISVIFGLTVFISPLGRLMTENPSLPSVYVFMNAIGALNDLVAPLSMFIIGLRLAEMPLRNFLCDREMYSFLFLRMLLLPAICFGILKIASLLGIYHNSAVAAVAFLCAATPAATATSMFAEKYGGDAHYAGKLVSVSTMLSVATMPVVSLLLKWY